MSYISYTDGKILIAGKNKVPKIYVETDDKSILRAVNDLCDDFQRVTGKKAQISTTVNDADIIIRKKHSQRWESYEIFEENEKLVICGSDKRGTIYGIYDLSQKIGVSPWYWWADVTPIKRDEIYFNPKEPYIQGEPSVKYRGIFINDEESLSLWALDKGDYDFTQTYKRVFELMLRLRANILWPAMHPCSPYFHKNPENAKNADLYGIIMGASHCELMLRNNVYEYFPFEEKWEKENPDKPLYKKVLGDSPLPCAYVFTDTNPDTGERVYNKELIRAYWSESLELFGEYENMYTVGMRGLHDYPWQPVNADTPEEKAKIIEEAIMMQREIIEEYKKESAKNIPQIFVPYKEILEIYNSGMEVPDDITLMWTNDNFGYIRQLPTDSERERSGSAGMYYHLSYCGKPKSYLWLSTTPFALMREELTKAYNNGIDRVWIANVGDIKAAERQTEYFLDLAWDIQKQQDIKCHIKDKAIRDFNFNEEDADEFSELELQFERLAFSRKPEFFNRGMFNLKSFNDEGQTYIKSYDDVLRRSESLYEKMDKERKKAYFELHLYALRACKNTAYQYITMDEQKQHLEDGYKLAAEKYIYMSDNAFYGIMEDTKKYHSFDNGKWNHIMDSAYGFYVERNNPCPLLECKKEWGEKEGLGVTYENMTFSPYTKERRFIDIFNPFWMYTNWKIKKEFDFIIPDKKEGRVLKDERIWIDIDYERAPKEMIETEIVVESDFGDRLVIPIVIDNNCEKLKKGTFAEANGYVSVMAENYTKKVSTDTASWEKEMYLGREGNSVKVYSDSRTMDISDTAVLEYDAYFKTTGEFEVEIYRIPTLNELGKVRFAIGINDDAPEIIECNNKYINFSKGDDAWGAGVLTNCEVLTAKIRVKNNGMNTIKLYAVDENVIIEKIVVWTGNKIKSYFGPPETKVV